MQALTTWRLWQADATARGFEAVRRLLEEKGLAGREWELRYEYPARLLPDSEAVTLRDVGAGEALEVICWLGEGATREAHGSAKL